MAKKKAVLIGINYPNSDNKLFGCVNDAMRMRKCLIDRYGFQEDDVTVLIDTDRSYTEPTGKNIRQALLDLVASAEAGDVLVVHYSGHGTRLPAETGEDDDTGFDECIVPSDFNLITDDDFRELVNKVPKGCNITIISDSCNSGGLIDDAKEQIGESTKKKPPNHCPVFDLFHNVFGSKETIKPEEENRAIGKPRFLPVSSVIQNLKQKTGKEDIDVRKLRSALFDIFGEDSTPKVKKFMVVIHNRVENLNCRLLEDVREKLREVYAGIRKPKISDGGILISGCQTDELSADLSSTENPGEAYGALSNAIQTLVAETNGDINNFDLVTRIRKLLKERNLTQKPGLYCSDRLAKARFLYEI